jgi:predicted esterase
LLAGAEELTPGRVVDRIACRDKAAQSYALYLPAAYTPEKRWPVLYLLDARGRALIPIERFRGAAEEFGWILVSSYNSASDTEDDPNTPAVQAMWADTHARLALDDRRVYLTGFSGCARASMNLAWHAPKAIAGVIGCGAGLPDEKMSVRGLPFLYFGTVGDRDFNYYEMRELAQRLSAAKVPYRIEFFEGGHDWAPPALAGDAIAWMELEAMKSGIRRRDEARISALYSRDLARADALAAAGDETAAALRYARVAEDYRGLVEVAVPAGKAAALEQLPAVRKSLRDAEKQDDRDRAAVRELARKVNASLRGNDFPLPGVVATELGIAALRKQAASGSPEEKLAAERILANLRAQLSFYLPEEFFARKDYRRARLALAVATTLDPDEPLKYYNLACADARGGQAGRAVDDLQQAVDKGFRRFELIDTDPDFDAIRGDPKFQKWLDSARTRAVPIP